MKKGFFKTAILKFTTLILFVGCSNAATEFYLPSEQDMFSGKIFYNNKVDILFVTDNSSSMLQHQRNLAKNVNGLVAQLNQLKMDYRVAVTTTTMTADVSKFPETRKLLGAPTYYLTAHNIHLLADRLVVGESGSDLERGLDAMAYVTSESYLKSINSDFIRPDALLAVIFLSDEEDMSSEFGSKDKDFIDYLYKRKPSYESGAMAWMVSYIGNIDGKNCDVLGGSPSMGKKYMNLVKESQGVQSSICDADLAGAVSNIRARIVDQITAYTFKDEPNVSTIKVVVGGRQIFQSNVDGWTYEVRTVSGRKQHILRFHGSAIPAADQQVSVIYTAIGAS